MGHSLMYKIIILKKAKKFIDALPKNERIRVVTAIEQLPNGSDIKPLKGHDGLVNTAAASIGSSSIPPRPQSRSPQYMAIRVTRGSSPRWLPTSFGSSTERVRAAVA